jgi:hypothetical protein
MSWSKKLRTVEALARALREDVHFDCEEGHSWAIGVRCHGSPGWNFEEALDAAIERMRSMLAKRQLVPK